MNATIISVGDELLMGKTINTNQAYLSKELSLMGIETILALSVKDAYEAIHRALKAADTDLVILTGGLGPTADDLTKEAVSDYFNLKLELNEDVLATIKAYFEKSGREMKDTNLKQAYFPKEATILGNGAGTAPGMMVTLEGVRVILLPGPPSELKPMFEPLKKTLDGLTDKKLHKKGLRLLSIGESEMEARLESFYKTHDSVYIASYAETGELTYFFSSYDETALDKAIEAFKAKVGNLLICDATLSLEEDVVRTLRDQGKHITLVESCTGGYVASRIVSVADASSVFNESYVLYSNEAKIKQLGINGEILNRYGAVSDQCVYELAYQLQSKTSADITLSVSGIAGPSGGTDEKPVGLVYFGLTHKGATRTYHKVFSGTRQQVIKKASSYGLYLVKRTLVDHED
ncbi:MAG: competence/damage-inducible protein A [Bacillota bacterium]